MKGGGSGSHVVIVSLWGPWMCLRGVGANNFDCNLFGGSD